MPIITAQPFPLLGHVLVQANWGDAPAAQCAQVVRVRVDTGEEAPLRPYIYPCSELGEFITLSGGHAIFWDTEAPLDTSFFYRTTSPFVLPTGNIFDSFTAPTVNGWGVADTLQPWSTSGGSASDYSKSGGTGRHSNGTVGTTRRTLIGSNISDFDMRLLIKIPVVATGASIVVGPLFRYLDANNHYRLSVIFDIDNTVDLLLTDVTGGATTTLATVANVTTYAAGDWLWVHQTAFGTEFNTNVWHLGSPEPAGFQLTGTDGTFPAGQVGVRTLLNAGNSNALPVVVEFDNFSVVPLAVQSETDILTLASNGGFWLRDPVRPCNDRRVELCFEPNPACLPGPGIYFVQMGPESFPNNSFTVSPTNARRPISVYRQRRDADSSLMLATRMFTDRDALRETLAPGGDLLFSAPPNYGIPDRYMSIPPVEEERLSPDHRFQPKLHRLPYTTVDRPVGTTQGVCGSRFEDLCAVYGTWAEVEAAGLTWEDLVVGVAGGFDPGWKTFGEFDADFTDFAAATATGLTYQQLLEGDY